MQKMAPTTCRHPQPDSTSFLSFLPFLSLFLFHCVCQGDNIINTQGQLWYFLTEPLLIPRVFKLNWQACMLVKTELILHVHLIIFQSNKIADWHMKLFPQVFFPTGFSGLIKDSKELVSACEGDGKLTPQTMALGTHKPHFWSGPCSTGFSCTFNIRWNCIKSEKRSLMAQTQNSHPQSAVFLVRTRGQCWSLFNLQKYLF